MGYNWDWSVFFQPTPDGAHTYVSFMLIGAGWTLAVSLASLAIALLAGSVVGVMRTLPGRKTQLFARAYVELFRNVPLLVQMFVWYFVVPELLPLEWGRAIKQSDYSLFCTVVISLGLYTSPRIAEQVKSAVLSLSSGQQMAALALGMSTRQAYSFVLLPMSFRIILPPLTSELLGVIKNSAIASILGLMELTGVARTMQEFTFQAFEAFAGATLMYFLINVVIVRSMRHVERRAAVPGYTSMHTKSSSPSIEKI
jgi:glutamate/aspartate transport system permease protein